MRTATVYTVYEQLIINNIDLEAYDLSNDVYLYDKIKTTYNIFKSEYSHEIARRGEIKAFEEWLRGLPTVLSVPFYKYDILNIAYIHDLIKVNATEEEEDKFLSEYFLRLSRAFFTLKNNL